MSWGRRFMAQPSAVIGAALALVLVAIAVVGPHLVSADPASIDVEHGLSALGVPLGPGDHGLLGTDALGRDVWARLVAGAATSLSIATLSTLLALAIGLGVGLAAGYAGGAADSALMRLVDLVLSFPLFLLAILLAALFREADLASSSMPVILTLGVVSWTTLARVIRAKALVLARSEHVLAARAIGASGRRIVLRHVLPNIAGVVVAVTVLAFAQNLLAEAALSYLGLGPPPPAASWGRMLMEGRPYYRTSPHLMLAPGLAILVAVVAFNLLGEGLRRAVDPKEHVSRVSEQ